MLLSPMILALLLDEVRLVFSSFMTVSDKVVVVVVLSIVVVVLSVVVVLG